LSPAVSLTAGCEPRPGEIYFKTVTGKRSHAALSQGHHGSVDQTPPRRRGACLCDRARHRERAAVTLRL